MDGPSPARSPSAGRAFVGLAILGWGVAIVIQVVPHEDRLVGAALALLGAALVLTAPRLPHVGSLPAPVVAGIGVGALATVLAYDWWFESPLDLPKIAILVMGAALVAASFALRRRIRVPWRSGQGVEVSTLVTCALPVFGAPLLIWGAQALFESLVGTTPIEVFVQVALIPPMAAFLWLLGWDPVHHGQSITYMTQKGLLTVDVGAACSGVQAMGLFTAVLAVYLLAERPGGRALATWSLIGIAGVYLTNVLRLFVLVVVGHQWGADALEQVHAQAGWIFFVAWALAFAWLVRRASDRRGPRAVASAPPAA